MESFGEILLKTRERFNISLDEAERMTSISRQYIEALECENIDIFPGEPYLVGFLRNYSEYLGLDAKNMISLYHAKKIQEAPIPEALLKDIKPKKIVPIIITIVCVILVACGVVCFFVLKSAKQKSVANVVLSEQKEGKHYQLTNVPITKRIYEGDTIGLNVNNKDIKIDVHETHTELALKTPVGILYAELGAETLFDVDGDKSEDIVIFVSDISKTDASTGAQVRMFLKDKEEIANTEVLINESEIPLESQIQSSISDEKKVLFEGGRAYPFTINASFRGACLYRYQTDKKDYIEDFYTTGDVVVMQAQNAIRVWMSNANAVKMQVIGDGRTVDIEIGRPGQVLVQDIKWIKDSDGRYKLVVLEVD